MYCWNLPLNDLLCLALVAASVAIVCGFVESIWHSSPQVVDHSNYFASATYSLIYSLLKGHWNILLSPHNGTWACEDKSKQIMVCFSNLLMHLLMNNKLQIQQKFDWWNSEFSSIRDIIFMLISLYYKYILGWADLWVRINHITYQGKVLLVLLTVIRSSWYS